MDEDIQEAVDRYVKAEDWGDADRQEALPAILAALQAGRLDLLNLVLHLEEALNDATNPTRRRFGVRLLSECISGSTPKLKLNFKHVETFALFFSSKLGDWQSVEGAVSGLLALFRGYADLLRSLKDKDKEDQPLVAKLVQVLFKEVHTPSHTQGVRNLVLKLVRLLLDEWRTEVQLLGAGLGAGIAATVENERDPRNLLLSFGICARLTEGCSSACVEDPVLAELFEILTGYFPITFTPPKDDKFGITGDDLRRGLSQAVAATPRFAHLAVPFFLDACKDMVAEDSEQTILQALEMLGFCLERYGADVTRKHLVSILSTMRDQVCRTTTPCPEEFSALMQRTLTVALRDVPSGLTPHWMTKTVDPLLKVLAEDAARGGSSLASSGSRRLLLASAAAHSLLLERTWTLTVTSSLKSSSGSEDTSEVQEFPKASLSFLLRLARLIEGPSGPLLRPRQLKSGLASARGTLQSLRPGQAAEEEVEKASDDEASKGRPLFAVAVELVGCLCRLIGEESSGEPFGLLCVALLPPATPSGAGDDDAKWAAAWRAELASAGADDARVIALADAILGIAELQPARAAELAPAFLAAAKDAPAAAERSLWLPEMLPRLLASTAVSLAPRAVGEDATAASSAGAASDALLVHIVALTKTASAPAVLRALAEALDAAGVARSAVGTAALSWVAEHVATALQLPDEILGLRGSLTEEATSSGAASSQERDAAAQLFVRTLASRLPPGKAAALRTRVLEIAASAGTAGDAPTVASFCPPPRVVGSGQLAALVLVPAVLPEAASDDWGLCQRALPLLQAVMWDVRHTALEPVALEALGALVHACPQPEVEGLLKYFREAFGQLLLADGASSRAAQTSAAESQAESADLEHEARAAVRCWAVVAGSLLRRGGFAVQAAGFLGALLAALERDGPVTRHVPLAFQALMPPSFGTGTSGSSTKPSTLPPLALQQLSRTTLPSLLERAKTVPHDSAKAGSSKEAKAAALESAVTLLCALPTEVACVDCSDELRWCTLTGLRHVSEGVQAASNAGTRGSSATAAGNGVASASAPAASAVFAAQVLQLLVRALRRQAAWVEDDLHSVVPPLTAICGAHGGPPHTVPLVRLGCLQALSLLIQQAHGHLMPYKRVLEKATQRMVEDRRREVRLSAVECLNAWHCGMVADN